ncbi:putative bifunctional diguanylate cyclase/phosphodiesterase [Paucibacter sp. Y2R2-4]|uniref:putative bifunctional diguanylate cyclase/phosphodiesterase n=1 Tax=Paucibacter sp. Y2R2-4 TaxID=2893553 RepID=UPI0021E38324|nr:GGDEF domain-containing phosphodiesterase [Paucibacter sp. Y2R2-4]MCV2349019.1 EAL domain-containing protein [Paucibacter sp. Y2R2-4]
MKFLRVLFGGEVRCILAAAPVLMSWRNAKETDPSLAPQSHKNRPFPWRSTGQTLIAWALVGLSLCSLALLVGPPGQESIPAGVQLFLPLLLLGAVSLLMPLPVSGINALLLALTAAGAAAQSVGPFARLSQLEQLVLWMGLSSCAAALPILTLFFKRRQDTDKQQFHAALEALGQGSSEWRVGAEGCQALFASAAWQQRMGPTPADLTRPLDWLSRAHPLDRERVSLSLEAQIAGMGPDMGQELLRLFSASGAWASYELHCQVLARDSRGQAERLLCTLRDVSQRLEAEERQRMSVSLFEHLQEGLLVTDTEFRVLDANPSFCQMLGQDREVLLGQAMAALEPNCLRRSGHSPEQVQKALLETNFWRGRVQTERADGSRCHLQLTVASIPEPDGPLRYRVVTVNDLTQLLQQQELLARQASTDALTGLPNQAAFMQTLRQGLLMAERENFRLSVCRLDLDQFKQLNQQYGSEVGDALLQQLAQRLQAALRSAQQWSDAVARLHGDEFALLLRSSSPEEAQRAMDRIQKILMQPFRFAPSRRKGADLAEEEELVLSISASIGATVFPQDKADAETLMRHAGHALYRVKHAGRKGFQLFDTAKHLRDEASLLALARVQQALDAGELRLHYQPKIDMSSGQVLGVEALLRWQHPDQGLLAPLHFLPLIEPTGLGIQVGDWVIEQALKQSAEWLRAGLQLEVSVNVTARQLQTPDFALRLQELIQRHQEPVAQHLCLEVLESAALADVRNTDQLIQSCRDFGVRFALDDFGTGYSTLTYLKRLTVNALKIDRSFVQNMLIDEQDSALVEGVIGLARTFECAVVAEGVETAAHARALLKLGCLQGQGNGIAPAMPPQEVQAWIESFGHSHWHQHMNA